MVFSKTKLFAVLRRDTSSIATDYMQTMRYRQWLCSVFVVDVFPCFPFFQKAIYKLDHVNHETLKKYMHHGVSVSCRCFVFSYSEPPQCPLLDKNRERGTYLQDIKSEDSRSSQEEGNLCTLFRHCSTLFLVVHVGIKKKTTDLATRMGHSLAMLMRLNYSEASIEPTPNYTETLY